MILDKEEFVQKATLVSSHAYNTQFDAFVKTLRWTRMPLLKRNGFFMAAMQSNMLRTLFDWQHNLQEIQKCVQGASNEEEKKKEEKALLIQKQWIRVLQTIADGIAWRSYSFDRPLLRIMSENDSPGPLLQLDYDYFKILRNILIRAPYFRIVNDLTRFLRIADITVFYPDKRIILFEVKARGNKIFDSKTILNEMRKHKVWPNSQKLRQLVAQMSIINRKIDVPIIENDKITKRIKVEIVDLDFPIKHHFRELKKLIKKAEVYIFASELVEEGYYIEVIALDKIDEKSLTSYRKVRDSAPTWTNGTGDMLIKLSNYDSFFEEGTNFTRNILPYSVLPLPSRDCIKLMSGHLKVSVFIDLNVLKEKFVQRGWRVTKGDIYDNNRTGPISETSKLHMFDKVPDDILFHLEKDDPDGIYIFSVLLTDVLIMATSYYAWNFILDSAEAMFYRSRSNRKKKLVAKNFVGEGRVLI